MDFIQEYRRWMEEELTDFLREELTGIQNDQQAIRDRFYRHLEFGTGGLRGVIGAGTNRMNTYTVGRASQGLADYLRDTPETPSICIAYDTRNFSREFARTAAEVFCANGIQTYLYKDVRPTPMLSFAVRQKKSNAGIVITASHNPKEYNGYKVYGPDGGQITDHMAAAILGCINRVDVFTGVKRAELEKSSLLSPMGEEVDAPYFAQVKGLSMRKELLREKAGSLKILYSPLHGGGNIPVRRALKELGFSQVDIVSEQEMPDGDFPTTPCPNPEEPAVFALAIQQAETTNPDLIFATDPDCDRIGVLVRNDDGEFSVLTGNQVGALLCDYIITTKKELGELPENPAVVKTIVTTEMAAEICKTHGVTLADTLTGFKYIGEKIGDWEESQEHTFLFGFEESYGYLAGTFVRDKDAVIAAALIAEMALYYKAEKGLTLFQAMQELYRQYGYFTEKLISINMSGAEGQEKIAAILSGLRMNYREILSGRDLAVVEDYKESMRFNLLNRSKETLALPKSHVLKFRFADESWLVLRPSGTEPKIKLYLGAKGDCMEEAEQRGVDIEVLVRHLLG